MGVETGGKIKIEGGQQKFHKLKKSVHREYKKGRKLWHTHTKEKEVPKKQRKRHCNTGTEN